MVTEMTIAGYSVEELAGKWQQDVDEIVKEALAFHANDDGFAEDCADGVPAEILNTAEQDAWNVLRNEFGTFGFDAEAEEAVAEIIEVRRRMAAVQEAEQAAFLVREIIRAAPVLEADTEEYSDFCASVGNPVSREVDEDEGIDRFDGPWADDLSRFLAERAGLLVLASTSPGDDRIDVKEVDAAFDALNEARTAFYDAQSAESPYNKRWFDELNSAQAWHLWRKAPGVLSLHFKDRAYNCDYYESTVYYFIDPADVPALIEWMGRQMAPVESLDDIENEEHRA